MKITTSEMAVTAKEIASAEMALGINFPTPLQKFYLAANGGRPELYVFENERVDTVVAEFLPLQSESKGTSVRSYMQLVQSKKLVPPNLFPFAVDGGGDYFFIDCSTPDGTIYFLKGDSAKGVCLLNLHLSFDAFCDSLKEEQ